MRFGGEERLEDPGLCFGIDATSGVTHSQHHIIPGLDPGVPPDILVIQIDVAGLNRQLAALRHGIASIDRKI